MKTPVYKLATEYAKRHEAELEEALKYTKLPGQYIFHFLYKAWRAGYERGRKSA